MAAAEESQEPLRYQTLALKVRIHCEGCKKKVKKVLHSIEGVYKTDIDMQQQKVVVIGNVSADALVKKLHKTGKHAEPWPEPAPPPPADGAPDGSPGSGGGGAAKKKKKKNKSKNPAANSNPAEQAPPPAEGGGPSPPDNAGACGDHDKPDGGAQPGAGDPHGAQPVAMTPHGPQPMPPAANGGGKKKGKNKGGGGGHGNANGDGAAAGAIVEVHAPEAPPTNQQPVTVVDAGYFYSAPAPGSYYMFSEENANACSVM